VAGAIDPGAARQHDAKFSASSVTLLFHTPRRVPGQKWVAFATLSHQNLGHVGRSDVQALPRVFRGADPQPAPRALSMAVAIRVGGVTEDLETATSWLIVGPRSFS
jgi:hypothetical protein